MRRRATLPLILILSACLAPEGGIDRSVVRGVVRVDPAVVDETAGLNDRPQYAQRLRDLEYGADAVVGGISDWGYDAENDEITGDIDWYFVASALDADPGRILLRFATLPADSVFRVEILEQTPEGLFDPLVVEDVTATGEEPFEVEMEWTMVAEQNYAVVLSGLSGSGEAGYELGFLGVHPDTRHVSVGAYRSADPSSRKPVGGAAVGPFTLQDDWAWEATYQIDGIKAVITEPNPMVDVISPDFLRLFGLDEDATVTRVNENIARAYLFAGDWVSLTGALAAGTWYSSEPIRIDVPCGEMSVVDPLVLDAFAPLVIGREVDEEEPNDLAINPDFTLDLTSPEDAQDIGLLSGPGFVDIFRGHIDIGAGEGFIHDVDVYAFQVPEDLLLYLTMDWDDDAADIDVIVYDDTGEYTDAAATTAKPESDGGWWLYEPELMYYLVVAGYAGTPGTSPAYELTVEQVAP